MTPFEFILRGGRDRDGSEREPVVLSVDRNSREHPVQVAMYPFHRFRLDESMPGSAGFLTLDQLDGLIETLTDLRERMTDECEGAP